MKFLLLLLLFSLTPLKTMAAGSTSEAKDETAGQVSSLFEAKSSIDAQNYSVAIEQLNGILETDFRNADAWNLLGYAYRKLEKFSKSAQAYEKALKYNPEHRGALEYQGELFIATGKLADARANEQALKLLCPSGCEELEDLSAALMAADK